MQQMNLDLARTRGDLGIERAAHKADRVAPDWIEAALHELRFYAVASYRHNFTMEEARTIVEQWKPRPAGVDGRVWGAITREAIARGYIERVPNVYRAAASSNGSPKACYRRGAKA